MPSVSGRPQSSKEGGGLPQSRQKDIATRPKLEAVHTYKIDTSRRLSRPYCMGLGLRITLEDLIVFGRLGRKRNELAQRLGFKLLFLLLHSPLGL